MGKKKVKYHELDNTDKKRLYILREYSALAESLGHYPSELELREKGITRPMYRNVFEGSLSGIRDAARKQFPKSFSMIFEQEHLKTKEIQQRTAKTLKKHRKFFVTSAGSGPVNVAFLKSIMNYCKKNKATPIILPISQKPCDLDPDLLQKHVDGELILALEDIRLNKNLVIKIVDQNEKAANPISGFTNFGTDSLILPSAKQTYKSVPNKKEQHPRANMTPGAMTMSNLKKGKSKAAIRAEEGHIFGGIIVEIINDKEFITRQTQARKDFSFPDWGKLYMPNNRVRKYAPKAMIMGDLHSIDKDEKAFKNLLKLAKKLNIPEVVMHDIFDGKSINSHNVNKFAYLSSLDILDQTCLGTELKVLADDLNLLTKTFKKVHVVDSNHDDQLMRAMERGDILKDPKNAPIASLLLPYAIFSHLKGKVSNLSEILHQKYKISKTILDEKYPDMMNLPKALEFAVSLFDVDSPEKVNWMDLDSSLLMGGFELAMHGHQGANGARGSVNTYSINGPTVTGHSHSPEQKNKNIVVGHTSNPNPDYAKGGTSSWATCSAILYEDEWGEGQIQFIHQINHKMRIK